MSFFARADCRWCVPLLSLLICRYWIKCVVLCCDLLAAFCSFEDIQTIKGRKRKEEKKEDAYC